MRKFLLFAPFLSTFAMGLNFLFKIFLSYEIDKGELGLFYTLMDMIGIGTLFFSGFKDSLVVAYDSSDFAKVFFLYKRIFVVLGILLLVPSIYFFSMLFPNYPIFLFVILFFVNCYAIYISYLNRALKNYSVMLFENIIMSLGLFLGFFVLSYIPLLPSVSKLFLIYIVAYIVKVIYIRGFLKLDLKERKIPFSEGKEFLINTLLNSLTYFFSGLYVNLSSIIFLYFYGDNNALGEYQVVVKGIYFSLVAIFVFPLNTFTLPQISKLIANNRNLEISIIERKLVKHLIVFLLVILALMCFTKYAVELLFPSSYRESYRMLNLMLPTLPIVAYTTFALNILKGFNKFNLALIVRLLGSITFPIVFFLLYSLNVSPGKNIVLSLDSSFIAMFVASVIFRMRIMQ